MKLYHDWEYFTVDIADGSDEKYYSIHDLNGNEMLTIDLYGEGCVLLTSRYPITKPIDRFDTVEQAKEAGESFLAKLGYCKIPNQFKPLI